MSAAASVPNDELGTSVDVPIDAGPDRPLGAVIVPSPRATSDSAPNNVFPLRPEDSKYVPNGHSADSPASKQRLLELPFMLVAMLLGASLAITLFASLPLGIASLAVTVATAGVIRLLLPNGAAGMLEARAKPVDVSIFFAVALALGYLALSMPTS